MKSTLFLAFCVFLSAFSAMAQQAGVFKEGDLVVIEMQVPAGAAPSPATTYAIPPGGTIQLPKLEKPISVVGISCRELTNRVNEAYKTSGIDPAPTVKSIYFGHHEIVSHVVSVGGEVKASGEFARRMGMSLMGAINRAGGFTKTADASRIKLIRADKETIHDLREIKADGSNNPVLMDGDEVVVQALSATPKRAGLVQPGDEVIIEMKPQLAETPKPQVTYVISSQGNLHLPLLKQEIPAAGRSLESLVFLIDEAYKRSGIIPPPAVKTVCFPQGECCPPQIVVVRGDILREGEFGLRHGMRLMAIIDRAGGIDAGIKRLKILRAGKELIVDISELKPDHSNNPVLMGEDQIVVPGAGLLKPGDQVLIELLKPAEESPKFTTVYPISDQGHLRLPMLNQKISASDISVSTLARRIETAYAEAGILEAPSFRVTLALEDPVARSVSVGGEVIGPGEFLLRKGMTLMKAIERGGGFTKFAAQGRVKIMRDKKTLVYDLREIKPDGSNNPVLMDGDQIIVPKK